MLVLRWFHAIMLAMQNLERWTGAYRYRFGSPPMTEA
jgi:hypothetical protein